LGIGKSQAAAIIAVMVIAFAATTLDTSTRILRYVISELGEQWSVKPLRNRYLSTGVGLIFCLSLAVLPDLISRGRVDGGGGMLLWPLFGTGNQLLGGLALLVVTIWLIKIKRPIIYTLIPLVFLLLMTGWAMVENFIYYIAERQFHLLTIGVILMALEIVMIYHALKKGWELRKV
jgi:carbon starvation protein